MDNDLPAPQTTPVVKLHQLVTDNVPLAPRKYPKVALFYLKALSAGAVGYFERRSFQRQLQGFELPHPPLFVLGHWRSGTSFLQSLIGAAPGYVYYNKFQTIFPDSFLLTRHSLKPLINYLFTRSPIARSWKNGLSHNFDSLDTASEIEVAMINQMNPYSFHWGQVFPQSWKFYFDRYLFMDGISQQEYKAWQRSVRLLNKKVNFTAPNDRLVVKNPGDTARLSHLRKLYPEAKFIFIHRHPYDVFYSNIKLWKRILSNLAVQETDEAQIKRSIRYIYRRMHEQYFADRVAVPESQLVEMTYEDFRKAPVDTLGQAFDQLGLPGFQANRSYYEAYAGEGSFQPSRYDYQAEDLDLLEEEWGTVMDELGYERSNAKSARAGSSKKG